MKWLEECEDLGYTETRQKIGWLIMNVWWFITEPLWRLFLRVFDVL